MPPDGPDCGMVPGAHGARTWSERWGARFGVELVVLSCLTDGASSSFDAGYNSAVEAHIDGLHGPGSVKGVWDEIQRRRKEAYDAWAASQEQAEPDAARHRDGISWL